MGRINWPTQGSYGASGDDQINAGSAIIEFVKTGPMDEGGSFGPTTIMEGFIDDAPWYNIYLDNAIVVKPKNPSCTVTQSAISVTLNDVNSSQLSQVGNTANDKVFTIPLVCNTQADISLSFSGTVADNATGVFKNTESETSDAVGIQLLDQNNNPVETGAGKNVQIGKVAGSLNYQMTARYYALASNAPAGNVSTVVYATIIYN